MAEKHEGGPRLWPRLTAQAEGEYMHPQYEPRTRCPVVIS